MDSSVKTSAEARKRLAMGDTYIKQFALQVWAYPRSGLMGRAAPEVLLPDAGFLTIMSWR